MRIAAAITMKMTPPVTNRLPSGKPASLRSSPASPAVGYSSATTRNSTVTPMNNPTYFQIAP